MLDAMPTPPPSPIPAPAPTPPTPPRGRVLLVDDEGAVLAAYGRILSRAGFSVEMVGTGAAAAAAVEAEDFDVVMTDIRLPGMSGVDLLRHIRQRHPDVPVVLMTGSADVATAIGAVEHGALRYLVKPVEPGVFRNTAEHATQLRQVARVQREAFDLYGRSASAVVERTELSARFDRALEGLHMAYQPIVRWSDRTVFAYEALVRTTESTLARPDHLFEAAEKLGRLRELSRAIRNGVAATIQSSDATTRFFVNLHPLDLNDPELMTASPLSAVADRVVLEITERASLDKVTDLRGCLKALRDLGFQLAIDDLGAGYSGLAAFAQLDPKVVKLDMSLVRNVESEPTKQKLIASMAALCEDLGILVVAEGVETAAERDALVEAGCDLLQGYLFARPSPPFVVPRFESAGG